MQKKAHCKKRNSFLMKTSRIVYRGNSSVNPNANPTTNLQFYLAIQALVQRRHLFPCCGWRGAATCCAAGGSASRTRGSSTALPSPYNNNNKIATIRKQFLSCLNNRVLEPFIAVGRSEDPYPFDGYRSGSELFPRIWNRIFSFVMQNYF